MTERERGGFLKKARLTKNSSYMQHFHLLLFISTLKALENGVVLTLK